jgi:hypothetical protein
MIKLHACESVNKIRLKINTDLFVILVVSREYRYEGFLEKQAKLFCPHTVRRL